MAGQLATLGSTGTSLLDCGGVQLRLMLSVGLADLSKNIGLEINAKSSEGVESRAAVILERGPARC